MTGFIVWRCDKQHDGKNINHEGPCRFAVVVNDGHYVTPEGKRRQRQRWLSFKTSEAANTWRKREQEADAKLAEIVTKQREGELVRPNSGQTLVDYLRAWLKTKKDLRPRSVRSYLNAIDNHIAAAPLGLMRLSDVELFDIESYLRDAKGGHGAKELQRSVLGSALGDAVRLKTLKVNPAKGAKLPKRKHTDVVRDAKLNCLTVSDAKKLLRTVDAKEDAQMAAFVHLGLDTGARKSELFGLKWSDIDFEACTVAIERQLDAAGLEPEFGPTKNGKTRVVEITPQTIDRLRAHRKSQNELKMANRTTYADFDLVIAREERDREPGQRLGEPIKTLSEHRFAKLVETAGVRRISAHGLRHTTATALLSAGTPAIDVAGRLGHDIATLNTHYAHALPQNQKAVAKRVAGLLAVG